MKLICIPAYNEESKIGNIVKECLSYGDRVIVCDDGSTDDTAKIAKANGAQVISHQTNLGKGAALRTIFKHAKDLKAEVTVTIDGDGQFYPKEIPNMMNPILEKKGDIVVGYRFENNDDMPSYRVFGNKFLAKMASVASNSLLSDVETGFRSYSYAAVSRLKFSSNTFGADAEILVNASHLGLTIIHEKVTVIYNTGGRTSTKNPVSLFADMAINLIELIAIHHPLKFLGVPGLILVAIGLVFTIIVATIFNDTRYFSIPSMLVAVGSLSSGLLLLLMSIVLFSIGKNRQYL
jgi:glycosyltransferase involved in cell wall biosynthesis